MKEPSLMDFMILAPAKPPYRSTFCNGCGQCCLAVQCETSRQVFGDDDARICPALEWDNAGSLYRCRLIRTQFKEVTVMSFPEIGVGGVGKGCGCPDDVADDLVDLIERGLR
jgi:hypothetical protein